MYIYTSLSLSLSMYIYIYTYSCGDCHVPLSNGQRVLRRFAETANPRKTSAEYIKSWLVKFPTCRSCISIIIIIISIIVIIIIIISSSSRTSNYYYYYYY